MVNNNGVNDFGANDEDGRALEIYLGAADSTCDDTIFEKNQVDEGAGVVEIGGALGQVSNLTVRYNACYKNGAFCALRELFQCSLRKQHYC